jgi:hypothetical protein
MGNGLKGGLGDPLEEPLPLRHRGQFRVGAVSVQLASDHSADVELGAALEPFRVEGDGSDIDIRVAWVSELHSPKVPRLFDSGSTWRLYEKEDGFQFDFVAAIFGEHPIKRLLIDRRFREANLQMNGRFFADRPCRPLPLGYPLDELLIMHRLTQERAIELHGVGIVGPDGIGNLFVGHSGAGKSTTARLWTSLHDVEILSDDRIIVREDLVREDPVREDLVREDSSQDDRAVLQLAEQDKAKRGRGGMRMYGTPWHGEAHFALPQRAPLQRIFVLEHGQHNVLTRLTRSQVVGELFARSFVPFHRHEYVDSALSFLERVADTVPCYRYSFEPDERAVEKLLGFRD